MQITGLGLNNHIFCSQDGSCVQCEWAEHDGCNGPQVELRKAIGYPGGEDPVFLSWTLGGILGNILSSKRRLWEVINICRLKKGVVMAGQPFNDDRYVDS